MEQLTGAVVMELFVVLVLLVVRFFKWACAPDWSRAEQERIIDEMVGIQ
jgi:hypothetical protein